MLTIIFFAIIITVVVLLLKRRTPADAAKGGGRRLSFSAPGAPEETLKTILEYAHGAGYKIASLDEYAGKAVLDEAAGLMSWGFYLPVSVEARPEGGCQVEVGIKSKLIQVGPVVTMSHKRCVKGMQAALGVAA